MSNKFNVFARLFAVAALACAISPAAKATPVTWLVAGFTFTDGSVINGGATFDATSDTYSNILVEATGGTLYNNVFFLFLNPSLPVSPSYLTLVAALPSGNLTGVASLWIIPESPINGPAGSVVHSSFAIEALCADATCSTYLHDGTLAASTSGLLGAFPATTSIPEPATALLLPGALLALAGLKRFRSRRGQLRQCD